MDGGFDLTAALSFRALSAAEPPSLILPFPSSLLGGASGQPYLGGVQSLMAGLGENRPPPTLFAEIQRILELPICTWLTPAEEEEFNRRYILAHVFENRGCGCGCTGRFFNVQANAISTYEKHGGLCGIIAVGWGKTLICLVAAGIAVRKGMRRVCLMVPAHVAGQLWNTDIPWARRHTSLPIEFFNLHGLTAKHREGLVKSPGKVGCFIFPYSLLSRPDAFDILRWISPDLLICDEAQNLGDEAAARTRRWLAYVRDRQPEIMVLSGGITSKGPKDYEHLIMPALRSNSPLPRSAHLMNDWQAVLASNKDGDALAPLPDSALHHLKPLLAWARDYFPSYIDRMQDNVEGARTAFQARLTTAPGVVATGDANIGVTLTVNNRWAEECPWTKHPEQVPGWDNLQELIKRVDVECMTPNGDPISHALHKHKWLDELSAGFYNALEWPKPDVFAKRRGLDPGMSEKIIQGAIDHHEAVKEYNKALRTWFGMKHRPGLDTPFLVGRDLSMHGGRNCGEGLFQAWKKAQDLKFDGMPERDGYGVRICPFKVWAAVEWAREFTTKGRGGIIWVDNKEMGRWVFEGLTQGGVDHALHCPAGDKNSAAILDQNNKQRCIVASIDGHGTGKNLQFHQNQLIVQWPRNAKMAQQLLGRLHRQRQSATELYAHTLRMTPFDKMNFAACLVDAVYIQQTTGDRQKIVTADYDPLPELYPPEWLRERGFENELLSAAQMSALRGTVAATV